MVGTLVHVNLGAGPARKGGLDGIDSGSGNVAVERAIVKQHWHANRRRQIQVVLNSSTVVTHCRVHRASCSQMECQTSTHAKAYHANLAGDFWRLAQGLNR